LLVAVYLAFAFQHQAPDTDGERAAASPHAAETSRKRKHEDYDISATERTSV